MQTFPLHDGPTTRQRRRWRKKALVRLIRDLFSVDELSRAIREYPEGAEILGELPPTARPNDVFIDTVDALARRGVDREFFDILIDLRPRRRGDIEAVARLWIPDDE